MSKQFLPISKADLLERGIEQLDFVYIIGDAYVDHPSFGHAIISRVLESYGYSVGIISQPDWKDKESISILGKPRLGFLISAGNMDSMVNHYSVSKKQRQTDSFTPGGVMGKRPDYATVVYSNLVRQTYKDVPIIIGGIEASLRRLGHYDYWSNKMKRSVLLDSGADILLYGMGEKSIIEVADALNSGLLAKEITFIEGTCYKTKTIDHIFEPEILHSFEEIKADKRSYAKSFYIQYQNTDPFSSKTLVEAYPNGIYVVQNTPSKPLTQSEMDRVYSLPYMRGYHPSYKALGGVPAIEEVLYSLVSNRGCFGGCNFCALTFHQGRIIQSRSHDSILKEANQFIWEDGFKGYIHDVGGPTANFRFPSCEKQMVDGVCKKKQCLFPTKCKNLKVDHQDYLKLLRKLRELPKVKKVFIRSGIRFDYLTYDKDPAFFEELTQHHISGQLKVAPEHISWEVLSKMGKPHISVYEEFSKKYKALNQKFGKNQFLVPYFMSSHPGSTMKEAIALAEYLRDLGYMPEQVQDFYPTPSTIATCMYYTQLDPRTMEEVYVPTNPHEKAMQRALIQYRNPNNYALVHEALTKYGRKDLIGFEKNALIKPRNMGHSNNKDMKKPGSFSGKKPGNKSEQPQKKKKTIRNLHKKRGK